MSKNENQPWMEVEPGDEGEPECTVVHLAEVVLPEFFTREGRVPFGVVVPVGGAAIPGGPVQYPKGYFARPITLASPAEDRALLEELIYGRPPVARVVVANPDGIPVSAEGVVLAPPPAEPEVPEEIRLLQQVGRLARALFVPYYGEKVVQEEILPYLPLQQETLLQLGMAATKRQEVVLRVKKGAPAATGRT